jgi:hypothetical protein
MKIDSETVGIAAEFAVASELARRNISAQPTFGHQKRTDLLVFGKNNRPIRIEAKGKLIGLVRPATRVRPTTATGLLHFARFPNFC